MFDYLSSDAYVVSAIRRAVPPVSALDILQGSLSAEQLNGYTYCHANGVPLPDKIFMLWKYLQDEVVDKLGNVAEGVIALEEPLIPLEEPLNTSITSIELDATDIALLRSGLTDDELVAVCEEEAPLRATQRPTTKLTTLQQQTQSFPFNNTSFPGDGDNDVLPYPIATVTEKKRQASSKNKGQDKFFILTSHEAVTYKLKAAEEKKKKEEEKLERLKIREQKKQENKINSNNNKKIKVLVNDQHR